MPRTTTSPDFFESMYQRSADPWSFAEDTYEQGRFATIASALSHRRYHRAFEPGCSIGTLTERLASLCDHVDASDFSPTAVKQAQQRCRDLGNVSLQCAPLTLETSLAGYDLVVFSEIGYYFTSSEWRHMMQRFVASMDPGTTLLACHWLGHSKDHLQSGDEVHAILEATEGLTLEHTERHEGFRLARLIRP